MPAPPAASLRVELLPARASVRSGAATTLHVKMTNLTNAPLALDVTLGCSAFEAAAYREGEDERADEEIAADCAALGGLCGRGFPVRVILEPRGALTKRTVLAAKVKRLEKKGDGCAWRPLRALPAGRYVVRVALPFADPVAGSPQTVEPRSAAGALSVVP